MYINTYTYTYTYTYIYILVYIRGPPHVGNPHVAGTRAFGESLPEASGTESLQESSLTFEAPALNPKP